MAITGHNSVGGYRAYAKPNNNYKREALSGIVNRLDGLPSLPSSNATIVSYFLYSDILLRCIR